MEYTLSNRGLRATKRGHVLVAEAFLGPCPEGQLVRHYDDNGVNNVVWNLLYGTYKQNSEDMIRNRGHWRHEQTHCSKNHEFTEENTYWRPNARGRDCKKCRKARRIKNASARRAQALEQLEVFSAPASA